MANFNSTPDTAAVPQTDPRAQEQRAAVLKQLQDQIQFARLKGNQHEVDRLQAQIDDVNSGPDTSPATPPVNQDSGSVADMVNSYQDKVGQDTDQNGVMDNLQDGGPTPPTMPTSTGSMYETTTTAPGLPGAPADVPSSAGPAPQFKSPYVQADRSGIESIQDLLAKSDSQRSDSRSKADEASSKAMGEADSSDKFIQDEYKRKRDINEWADVGQTVAHGLAQYGAAKQGLRSNVDMSGLKFDKVDYSKKVDQFMEEMKQGLGHNKDKRSLAERRRESDVGIGERQTDRSLSAALSGRSEEQRNREEDAKGQSTGIENENRFNQENYRTKESAAARVEAAKQRNQNASEGAANRAAIAEQARLDRLAKEKRDREQHEGDKKDKATTKSEEQKTKAVADLQAGVELIGDKKTAVKGEAQVAGGLSKLGVGKKDQDEIIELAKPNSLFEFGDTKKKKLYEKLQAIQADIDSGRRTKSGTPAEGGVTPDAGQATIKDDTVTLRGPSGQTAVMKKDAAQKYLSKPGYSIVQ